ncbi:MAG: enoyl-CoA hydratase/isomerase family protein [Bdellovibrionales bacterium]|nr:enoyl-CoA hydratase/isomerase family protein [Bdellovibrionales bacterium]
MKTIEIAKNNKISVLTLKRPDVRNAFDDAMIAELTQAFHDLKNEESCRVLILQGAGESFCAGADLNWMKSMAQFSREDNLEDSRKLQQMFEALAQLPMPVIGKIHGHAMGGGMGLVALCDVVAAVEGTKFCFSEVRLGIAPAVISPYVARKLSRSQMQRWFLTAEIFEAAQAVDMGWAHVYGDRAAVDEFVENTAEKISRNGPCAVRATKKIINKLFDEGDDIHTQTIQWIADLRVSPEGQEGMQAFFEKRKPNWI